jgi:tetratricopeptide (TPR) repeat protein
VSELLSSETANPFADPTNPDLAQGEEQTPERISDPELDAPTERDFDDPEARDSSPDLPPSGPRRQSGAYARHGDVLADLWERVRGESTVERKSELLRTLVELCDEREDEDNALAALESLFEINPHDRRTFERCVELNQQFGRWDAVVSACFARIEVAPEQGERIHLLRWVAQVLEAQLGDGEQALEALLLAWSLDVTDPDVTAELERLADSLGRWDVLIDGSHKELERPMRGERWFAVRLAVARWHRRTGELRSAERLIDQVLEAVPSHRAGLEMRVKLRRDLADRQGLAEALDGLASALPRPESAPFLLEAADLYRLELDAPAVAAARYRAVLELEPERTEALEALGQLYADRLGPEQDRPEHVPTLQALKRFHLERQQHGHAVRIAERLIALVPRRKQVALHQEAAELLSRRIGDARAAQAHYERVLELEPEHEAATAYLAGVRYEDECYTQALPLLRGLAQGVHRRSPVDREQVLRMYAHAAVEVSDDTEAITALHRLHEAVPAELEPLWQLAERCFRAERWAEVIRLGRELLLHHADTLEAGRAVELHYRMGVAHAELSDDGPARQMFTKALDSHPEHLPSLRRLAELEERLGHWESAAELQHRVSRHLTDPRERIRLLEHVGDLWKDRLGGLPEALETYDEALRFDPNDRRVLHKTLDTYREKGQWRYAVETLQRLEQLEEQQEVRVRYAYTAGVILRDELGDAARARTQFEQALDIDPTHLKAFAALDRLLTEAKDWKELERTYRRMLHRIVGSGREDLEFDLWHNLGIVYRDRRGDYASAAEAFRAASRLRPADRTEHRILGELYTHVPEGFADAVDEQQRKLDADPTDGSAYHALFELYARTGAQDRAWRAAAALVLLGKAESDERQYYEQGANRARMPRRITPEQWERELRHPSHDLALDSLFEALVAGVHRIRQRPDAELGLDPQYEVDPASSTVRLARVFGYAVRAFRLPVAPRLFIRPDSPGGLVHAGGAAPPASVCGSTPLSGFDPSATGFLVGRHLAYCRGGTFLRTLLPTAEELVLVLRAALRLAGAIPEGDANVEDAARRLQQQLDAGRMQILREVAPRFAEQNLEEVVIRWMRAGERTACRAGLLLCNDVATAAQVLRALPAEGRFDLTAEEKVIELARFSVSEAYHRLQTGA